MQRLGGVKGSVVGWVGGVHGNNNGDGGKMVATATMASGTTAVKVARMTVGSATMVALTEQKTDNNARHDK